MILVFTVRRLRNDTCQPLQFLAQRGRGLGGKPLQRMTSIIMWETYTRHLSHIHVYTQLIHIVTFTHQHGHSGVKRIGKLDCLLSILFLQLPDDASQHLIGRLILSNVHQEPRHLGGQLLSFCCSFQPIQLSHTISIVRWHRRVGTCEELCIPFYVCMQVCVSLCLS